MARNTGALPAVIRARLGERVRELAAGKLTQTELVARTGLGKGTIGDLWWGKSNPTLSTLLTVARVLGVSSIEELLAPFGTQIVSKEMDSIENGGRRTWET